MLEIALSVIVFLIGIVIGVFAGYVVAAISFGMALKDAEALKRMVCSQEEDMDVEGMAARIAKGIRSRE